MSVSRTMDESSFSKRLWRRAILSKLDYADRAVQLRPEETLDAETFLFKRIRQ